MGSGGQTLSRLPWTWWHLNVAAEKTLEHRLDALLYYHACSFDKYLSSEKQCQVEPQIVTLEMLINANHERHQEKRPVL